MLYGAFAHDTSFDNAVSVVEVAGVLSEDLALTSLFLFCNKLDTESGNLLLPLHHVAVTELGKGVIFSPYELR